MVQHCQDQVLVRFWTWESQKVRKLSKSVCFEVKVFWNLLENVVLYYFYDKQTNSSSSNRRLPNLDNRPRGSTNG